MGFVVAVICGPGASWHAPPGLSDEAALYDVAFVSAKRGWAVGDAGTILRSEDGGVSWSADPSPIRAQWRSVHFGNLRLGWVVGGWQRFDGSAGFGVALSTRDYGETWKVLSRGRGGWLYDIRTEKLLTGWMVGEGSPDDPPGVWHTRRGDREYAPLPGRRAPPLLDLAFASPEVGLAVGRRGRMVRFENGKSRPDGRLSYPGTWRAVDFGPGGAGCLVGAGGHVFVSNDAGANWAAASLRLPPDVAGVLSPMDVQCVTDSHFVVVGRPCGYVLETRDAGATWRLRSTGQPLPLHAVHFRDAASGWAVGQFGVICRTRDGGKTWETVCGAD